jgi:hypothetical protein
VQNEIFDAQFDFPDKTAWNHSVQLAVYSGQSAVVRNQLAVVSEAVVVVVIAIGIGVDGIARPTTITTTTPEKTIPFIMHF